MKKQPWNTPPHERERLTAQEKIKHLEKVIITLTEDVKRMEDAYDRCNQMLEEQRPKASYYELLRTKELVVMDGEAKYLTRETLDEYCKALREEFLFSPVSISQMLSKHAIIHQQFEEAYKEYLRNGSNTGSESQEADQKDSGAQAGVLRDADGHGVR